MHDDIRRGREAFRRRAWREAYRSLSRADNATPIGGDDLERMATAAFLIGEHTGFRRALERAHAAHLRAADPRRAARAAFWLGLTELLRGETGHAGGWLARARRHVDTIDCVEHGYLLLPAAERHLGRGDGEAAHAAAGDAVAIAERFRDEDLLACARHLQGRALIAQRRVEAGLELLDEAMLCVVAGTLSPIMTGLIYCSVIGACQQVFELRRAREWTAALSDWCERQPELVAFTGACLVHRAEIFQFKGAWPAAMAEASRAATRVSPAVDAPSAAAAFYRQAEIHRLRGELSAAEASYLAAARLGADPHPGLALLRAAEGDHDAACAALRRVLSSAADPLQRASLLPAYVEILLGSNRVDDARQACAELDEIARNFETAMLRALAAQARGALELACGNAHASIGTLRRALAAWQELEAPYESARVHELVGLCCRRLGDHEAAALELDAARAAFERLGAAPDVARLDKLSTRRSSPAHGLTPRELEVLRLVATGETNKAIAARLHLSERTIDRHVSNILSKLAVPSRAAATAWACARKLV